MCLKLLFSMRGSNDIFSSFQNNTVGHPHNVQNRIAEFNSRNRFKILRPLLNSYSLRIATFVFRKVFPALFQVEISFDPGMFEKISQDFLNNQKLLRGLAQEYDFEVLFTLQPVIYTKAVNSREELRLVNELGFRVGSFTLEKPFLQAYAELQKNPNLIDLSGAYGNDSQTIFLDLYHVGEKGNLLVANALSKEIMKPL